MHFYTFQINKHCLFILILEKIYDKLIRMHAGWVDLLGFHSKGVKTFSRNGVLNDPVPKAPENIIHV